MKLEENLISHSAIIDLSKHSGFTKKHSRHNRSGFNYIYNESSGIGTAVYISCKCGKKKDITDYSSW